MIHPPKQDESKNHACGNPRDSGFGRGALAVANSFLERKLKPWGEK
ncbi:hypothetical protein [Loktanella sp. SALINAS62]|nr:hypothetical protein [Loktanella sp. SALINAS62]MBS1301785.1 hypothetical protein [Loktanella sp. SALINAS62]